MDLLDIVIFLLGLGAVFFFKNAGSSDSAKGPEEGGKYSGDFGSDVSGDDNIESPRRFVEGLKSKRLSSQPPGGASVAQEETGRPSGNFSEAPGEKFPDILIYDGKDTPEIFIYDKHKGEEGGFVAANPLAGRVESSSGDFRNLVENEPLCESETPEDDFHAGESPADSRPGSERISGDFLRLGIGDLRRAVVLSEIISPPLALRGGGGVFDRPEI